MRHILFLFTLGNIFFCFGQKTVSKESQLRIDSLLSHKEGSRPGYAMGIVKEGQLVYSKGYGMANLDFAIANTDSTAFYIGSMAKQFTAAALLILEQEKKLDFDKEVTYYLPDFPNYGEEITISHLVHHTSGIRETNSLQLFQGIDRKFEEVFTTDDLYELIKAQKHLNFKPDDEYRYSSGGYAVLAKVVERISGQSFRDFLRQRIFKPLGMRKTFVSDNHNEVVYDRATSYWPSNNGEFERRSLVFDAYGDGGIITNVQDLAKWDKAFYNDLLGVSDFAKKMYQKGMLNDGTPMDYARALNVWNYRGQEVVQHNGGMLGFRVDMVRFPKLGTTIILLGNSAYLDPTGDALKIADILFDVHFKDVHEKTKSFSQESNTRIKVPPAMAKEREGYYWNDEMNYYRRISLSNDSLFLDSGSLESKQYLIPKSKNTYELDDSNGNTKLVFSTVAGKSSLEVYFGNIHRQFRKFDPTPPKGIDDVRPYIGTYSSAELQTTYTFFEDGDKLFLRIGNHAPQQVFPLESDSNCVWNGKKMLWIGFGEIKFQVGDKGIVKGFHIGDQRVSGVNFKKI